MSFLMHDWKQAWRQLTRRPVLPTAMVVTLGLGIGAASTVFSLVDGILLRPYPYRDPDRLVRVQTVMRETAGARRIDPGSGRLAIPHRRRRFIRRVPGFPEQSGTPVR
jgi:hypothetical protein